jgi:hypothetical protein
MGGACSVDGEERGVYRVLVGKPEAKRTLGRPRRRWEDNIRMDLQEVECRGMEWIGLAQDRDRWRAIMDEVRGELSYLAPLGSEKISASYLKQCFFSREGVLPPRLSQTPRLPVPRHK